MIAVPRKIHLLLLVGLVYCAVGAGPVLAQDLSQSRPCGPEWMKGPCRYLIPQGFRGADFRCACYKHDRCYEVPYITRKQCDDRFLQDMLCACECSQAPARCRRRARLMYNVVRIFGSLSRSGNR